MQRNKRIEMRGPGEPLELVVRDIPKAPPGGAVVKVLYAGICHSDIHIWEGMKDRFMKSNVLGHEISGLVHELGPGIPADSPAVGTPVIVFPWQNCGSCNHCKADNLNCTASPGEYKQQGVYVDGGYQEYVVVYDVTQLIPVTPGTPLDVGAIAACSGLTAYNAVTSLRDALDTSFSITGKGTVLLVGAGGLCLWAISHLKALWPGVMICVVDILKNKVDDAIAAGADSGVVWGLKEDGKARTKSIGKVLGEQADGAIDFTGHNDSAFPIFRSLRKGATWVSVGLFTGLISVPSALVATFSIRIQGVFVGNRKQLREVLQLIADKKVKAPQITYVTPGDVMDVFSKLKDGTQQGRAVMRFNQDNKL